MNFSDYLAMREVMEHEGKGGVWGQNTALWAIVAIIIVIAFLWWCNKNGDSKAELAASIQNLYGRIGSMEPIVMRHDANLTSLNSVTSATTQAVGDFKDFTNRNLEALDGAVFVPRCSRGGCSGGNSRFVKKDNYCLDSSSLQAIETCGE